MALPAIVMKGRRIRRFPREAATTYVEGAPVLLDASGEIIEAGADPAVLLGFAAHDAVLTFDPDPGFALVFVAYPDSTFLLEGLSDPVAADVGDLRELGVDANGVALVDDIAVAPRFTIEDIYIKPGGTTGLFEVSVISGIRQFQT